MKRKKLLLVSSVGGHLTQLLELESLFKNYDYHLVTEKSEITSKLGEEHPVSYLLFGARNYPIRYLFKFSFNVIKSLFILLKYRPDVIISTGAHTGVPMCYWGKLFRRKVIFIESFSKTSSPTLAGKVVYPIADLFIVQWESMKKIYPKATYRGSLY